MSVRILSTSFFFFLPKVTATKESLEEQLQAAQAQVEAERATVQSLQQSLREVKKTCVEMQLHAEQDEEFISNSLFKRIKALEHQKEQLEAQGADTQQLQLQIEQLRKDKVCCFLCFTGLSL